MQKSDIINISTSDLPEAIQQLAVVPKQLYLRGNQNLLTDSPKVGIVGSRKHTQYGKEVTEQLAGELARAGVIIVSGLAFGVDSLAHNACLKAGGKTIAVLPSGIETIYPASHRGLGEQILTQDGLLISEYEGKQLPRNHEFLERNRIIAALSDIVIITEAAERSGSLNTARNALELGKTVMAVPGPITSAYSTGPNQLIRAGAIPILSVDDVLNELGIVKDEMNAYLPENEFEEAILNLLSIGVTSGHELISQSGLEAPVFQTHLTLLEIKGAIEPLGNNTWRLK